MITKLFFVLFVFFKGIVLATISHQSDEDKEEADCIFYGVQEIGNRRPIARVYLECRELEISSLYKFKLEVARVKEDEGQNSFIAEDNSLQDNVEFEIQTPGAPEILEITADKKTAVEVTEKIEVMVKAVDDEENLPLSYTFSACDDKECIEIAPNSPNDIQQFTLPKGKFNLGFYVCNRHGICSEKRMDTADDVTVTALDLSKTDPEDLNLEGLAETSDDPFAILTIFVSGTIGEAGKTNLVLAEKLENAKQSVCKGSLDKMNTADPDDGTSQMAVTVNKKYLPENITEEIRTKFRSIAEELMKLFFQIKNRKKRAVDSQEDKQQMTPEQVVTFINTKDLEISQGLTADNSKKFQEDIKNYIIGMCRKIILDADPLVAVASLATVRSEKKSFDGISMKWLNAACKNCTDNAKFKLDTATEQMFKQWNCSQGTCRGSCIGSVELSKDIISKSTTAVSLFISPIKSKIMGLFMLNYDTEEFSNVPDSMHKIEIPVVGEINASLSIECRYWYNGNWNNSICSSSMMKVMNNSSTVTCTCSMYNSYVALFEAPKFEMTTMEETTESVNVTKSMSAEDTTDKPMTKAVTKIVNSNITSQNDKVTTETSASDISVEGDRAKAQFSLNANYDTVVTDKLAFEKSLLTQLATQLNISTSRISDISIKKGSIIVSLYILKVASGPSIGQVLTNLKTKVTNSQLIIKSPSGTTLVVMTNSFQFSSPTPAPTPAKKDDDDDSKKTVIIVVCVIVSIVLIAGVAIALFFIYKKNQEKKKLPPYSREPIERPLTSTKSPLPQNSETKETGIVNEGYDITSKSLVSLSNSRGKTPSRQTFVEPSKTFVEPSEQDLYNVSRTPAPNTLPGSTYGSLAPLENEVREQPSLCLSRPGSSSSGSKCPSRVGTPGSIRLNSSLGRPSPTPTTPVTPRTRK